MKLVHKLTFDSECLSWPNPSTRAWRACFSLVAYKYFGRAATASVAEHTKNMWTANRNTLVVPLSLLLPLRRLFYD